MKLFFVLLAAVTVMALDGSQKSSSSPSVTSELPTVQHEDEAAFRQAVGSSLGSLGFPGSGSSQSFQSAGSGAPYQPPYNALNSVYGITYHGDYNQLANYLQPGQAGAAKPNQKGGISSRFRNFMNTLFFRRSNKQPPAFVQPPSGGFGGSFGSGSSPSGSPFTGFGSSSVAGVPSSFGSSYPSGSGQYDFSTLVGASPGSSKGTFGPFSSSSSSEIAGLGSASGPFGSASAIGPFASSGSGFGSSSFGGSPAFAGAPGAYQGGSALGGSSSPFNRFVGSSGSSASSGGNGGTTYFPGETAGASGVSSLYPGSHSSFGKNIDEAKSDEEEKDSAKEEQQE